MDVRVREQVYDARNAQRGAVRPAESDASHKIAYLINQYPKVSHSFIRREILALEERGWSIFRVALRGWDAELVDPADIAERSKTTFVLRRAAVPLATAMVHQAICAPRRFLTALWLGIRMMRPSDRPLLWHLIYLAEACWIAPQLARRKITHLHVHFGTNPAEVAMLVSILSGISFSFTAHGIEEFDKATLIHLAEKVKRATFVVAVCSYGRGQIFRRTKEKDWHKVKVIRCGIDAAFAQVDSIAPSDSNRLVCVGRLCEEKAQILLVKAIGTLVKEGRKLELVLVGDGEHRKPIEQLISDMNLAAYVTITGWATTEEVRQEILKARALILPSFAEALPIVIIEAMSLGRPILSTYVGGIPELVTEDTGWLFPAGSEEDMLCAVRACLDAPADKLQAMGAAGRKRALQRHKVVDQAEALSALFEKTLVGDLS
jgi:glycosyltransferase involved in cell wall biosynthesis